MSRGNKLAVECLKLAQNSFVDMISSLLLDGYKVRFYIKGRSMLPLLKEGRDLVELRSTNEINKGDIVLAQVAPMRYVLHRIISKKGEELILMGDGNLNTIERCLCSDVVGKVVLIIRNGRQINEDSLLLRLYTMIWLQINLNKKYLSKIRNLILFRNDKRE